MSMLDSAGYRSSSERSANRSIPIILGQAWHLIVWVTVFATPAMAQPNGPVSKPDSGSPVLVDPEKATTTVTRESVEAAIKRTQDTSSLSDEEKSEIVAIYKQALAQLQKNEESLRRIQAGKSRVEEAKARLESLNGETASEKPEFSKRGLSELTAAETAAQASLLEAKDLAYRLKDEPTRLKTRLGEIPDELTTRRTRLKQLRQQLDSQASDNSDSPRAQAQRALLDAKTSGAALIVEELEQEIATAKALATLLPAEQEAVGRNVERYQDLLERLRSEIEKRQERESSEGLEKARQLEASVARDYPSLRGLAASIVRHAELLADPDGYGRGVTKTEQRTSSAAALSTELADRLQELKDRINRVGLTPATGIYLREEQLNLPNNRFYLDRLRARQERLGEAEVELIRLQSTRTEVARMLKGDFDLRSALPPAQGNKSEDERESELRRLLGIEQDYLNRAISQVSGYLTATMKFDEKERGLIQASQQLGNYIDANILWYASAPALSLTDFGSSVDAIVWLVHVNEWWLLVVLLRDDVSSQPIVYTLLLFPILVLLVQRRRLDPLLERLARRAHRRTCVRMLPTMEALSLLLLRALCWPLIIWFIAWRLRAAPSPPIEAVAVSQALAHCGVVLFLVSALSQFLRPEGLVIAHFDWKRPTASRCRFTLILAGLIGIPLIFLVDLMEHVHHVEYRATLGRLVFMLLMGLFAWAGLAALLAETRFPATAADNFALGQAALCDCHCRPGGTAAGNRFPIGDGLCLHRAAHRRSMWLDDRHGSCRDAPLSPRVAVALAGSKTTCD